MNPDDNSLCCQIIQHASKRHPADPENTAEFLFPREFVGYIQIQRMNILFQFRTNLRFKINLFYLFHYNHQFFLVYFLFCK